MATSSIPLQVIDDPAEFRILVPTRQLEWLAQAASGRVIHTPFDLAALLAQHPQASVRTVVRPASPLWETRLLWLLFMGLLVSEWILRRSKGLA